MAHAGEVGVTGASPLRHLTSSQIRVLRVLHAEGWLYKQAAVRLGMPETTLRTTIHRAVVRAGVSDRAELAYWLGRHDGATEADRLAHPEIHR